MLNALKLVCLFAALTLISPNLRAETWGQGGLSQTGSGEGDGDGVHKPTILGCTLASSGRLFLDTAAHNCNPGKSSVNGGTMPDDTGMCDSQSTHDVSNPPVTYGLGDKPQLNLSTIPIPKDIDCSGQACTVACRSGIKFMPSGKECDSIGTADMMKDIGGGQSCFKAIPSGGTLLPGDLVVYTHSGQTIGHVFFINSVDQEKKCFSINQAAGGAAKVGIETFCDGKPSMSGDQGEAIKQTIDVMNGKASDVKDKIKVVRFDDKNKQCQFDGKKFQGENSSCDVGAMKNGNN
jgi:hypothetical protein